jgi:hypothetical protein
MEKIAARAFPAFATGFALFYAPAYSFTTGDAGFQGSLFTYFPSVGDYGEIYPGIVAGSDTLGPPMWWYGWIGSSLIAGLIVAALAVLLPAKATMRIWSTLVWVAPILAFLFLLDYEMYWFVPGWMPVTSFLSGATAG